MNAKLFDLTGKVAIVTGSGRGLGKVMAGGLADFGAKLVVCNCTLEEVFENIMQGATEEHDKPEKQQQIITFTPIARRGKPEELIGAVVFSASDASSYITGAVLFVDGSYTAA